MSITVKITRNYGVEAIYPVCEAAKAFAAIANSKTLTRGTIELVKSLGYAVNVQQVAQL